MKSKRDFALPKKLVFHWNLFLMVQGSKRPMQFCHRYTIEGYIQPMSILINMNE